MPTEQIKHWFLPLVTVTATFTLRNFGYLVFVFSKNLP